MARLRKRRSIFLTELSFIDPTYKVETEYVQLNNGKIQGRQVKSGLAILVNHRLTKMNQMIRKRLVQLNNERKINDYRFRNNLYQWKLNGEDFKIVYNLKMIENAFPSSGKNHQMQYNDLQIL
jgi:hypothetical protein